MTIYTPAQIQEITAPIKLVGKCSCNILKRYSLHSLCYVFCFYFSERYITHPPETDATSCVLGIF